MKKGALLIVGEMDCGTIVKAHCVVMKVEIGKVIMREEMTSLKDFLKANGL